jgi:hypothetical protein
MKTCFKCKTAKPLSEFYKHAQMRDGHLNKCTECTKADARTHRRRYPERHREWDIKKSRHHDAAISRKEYIRTHPEMRQKTIERWAEKNKDKIRAQRKAAHAVKVGAIVRQPCAVCGIAEAQAHHEDYSKPLDVVWLCARHHSQRHREIRNAKRLAKLSIHRIRELDGIEVNQ